MALALADPFALALGDEGKNLENQVRDKRSHEVFALSGVKEGHIKDDDIDALFFGEDAPLFLDYFVIAAEAVDAQDVEKVAFPEPPDHALVAWSLEVFA